MSKSADVSVRQVGPKAAKRAIRKALQTRRPVFLWGPPGTLDGGFVVPYG